MSNYTPSKLNQIARWSNTKEIVRDILKCYICEYEDCITKFKLITANDLFNFGVIKRYECPNCDCIFGDLKFIESSQDEICKDYMDTYSYYKEGTCDSYFVTLLKKLSVIDKTKQILDYGCGNALSYQEQLNAEGYNIDKYDKYMTGNNIKNKIEKKYDIVFTHNTIEHVIDPINDVKDMVNCVTDSGLLIISSACWEYCYDITHFHTFFFLGKSSQILAKKCGIQLIDEIITDGTIIKIFKKSN